jgi:hypothetical protein
MPAISRMMGSTEAAPRGVKLCGHNGISAKRKFFACGTHRIDSDTWIAHESPTFAACRGRTTPTRGHVSPGEEDGKRYSDRVGDFFPHNFRSQTLCFAGVKNDRTTAKVVCAHRRHAAAANFLIELFKVQFDPLEEFGGE